MSTLPGPNAALLVVDVQTGVVAEAWERDRVVANVALAVDRARAAGLAVIWVRHEDDELQPGTAAWQWVPELQPLPSEACVAKQFNSAFEGTPLLPLLDQAGVSRLYLAGAASNWCIRATAYGALERGFDLTLISDAHTTEDMTLDAGRVVTAASMVDDLNTAMQWLSYPGRKNAVATAAEVDFGAAHCDAAQAPLMAFDPSRHYVHLAASGQGRQVPGGDAFWSLPEAELARFDEHWLVTEFECASDWPHWERHPAGDEFVYLLSGAATLLLELPTGVQRVPLQGRAAVLVPQGLWHTAEVAAPSRMLFITRGQGTEHRPVTNGT